MVNATIIGARGYLGRELVRLLSTHPNIDEIHVTSTSQVGASYGDSVPSLAHTELTFEAPDAAGPRNADVLFLATPGGEAAAWTKQYEDAGVKLVVDLSRDHRHHGIDRLDGWVYGLADVAPVGRGAKRVANPGCYPSATLLALAPALQGGFVGSGPIIVDGKSGVSGAGVSPREDLHYPEMNESVRAYKVLGHDHTAEIAGMASRIGGAPHKVRFTPHLVPQSRGLLSTVYAPLAKTDGLVDAYQAAYADSAFVSYVAEANTGHVKGSNLAQVAVSVDEELGLMVARGAIDNLCKGGSGTAIQNMNDAFGFPSALGLPRAGVQP